MDRRTYCVLIASLYTGAVDSNKEWFAESDDIRLLIDLGNCLMIGKWVVRIFG